MNLTDDYILKFQRGSPIFIDDICIIYSPTIGEIIDLNYSKFEQYLNVLLIEKPSIKKKDDTELYELMSKLSDFQYLLMTTGIDPQVNQLVRDAFYFFTHSEVFFIYDTAQIAFGPIDEQHLMNEEKFYEFRSILKVMFCLETPQEEIIINDSDDARTRALKERMRENRRKLQKAKAAKAKKEGSDLKFSDLIGSVTINGCALSMENIWNITYYAFHDQLKRMGWRDQFDINYRAAMAGAKIKKNQLKHWMRSIASTDNHD